MSSAALQIGPADAVTPFEVAGLSEDQARAYFVRLRFARWGGQPACEKCDCTAVYEYKARSIYKCKMCMRQFSATSDTPWAYRKLSFRKIMSLVAEFAHTRQGRTALDVSRNLRVQYKTVLVWLHKIRCEIAARSENIQLSGEVEIDGSYYGGFIRPKNVMKDRNDHRRVPYRSNSRALCVVAARQRGGPVRTWIAKAEGDARSFIRRALTSDATLFSDQAPVWSWLRGRHQLFTVNHKQAFYTPEACTNHVENYFRGLRMMERVHRHIAQHYLDFYAADAAWRIERNKWSDREGLADVMAAMSTRGRSPLTGYFQGRKRSLSLCQQDGTVTAWRPPTQAERRDRRRAAAGEGVPDEFGAPRRPLSRKTWDSGFTYVAAKELVADPSIIPAGPGVYTVLVKNGDQLLADSGFEEEAALPIWRHEGCVQLYVGESYTLRGRLLDHIAGNADASPLRLTLMALQHALRPLGEQVEVSSDRESSEASLSEWLQDAAIVGFKSCGYIYAEERNVLLKAASPMNLKRPNAGAFTKQLLDLRAAFRAEIANAWPRAPHGWRPKRR